MRKACFFFVLTALVLFGFAGTMVRADDDDLVISARMRGLNEVPPTTSESQTEFQGTISRDGTTITYTLTWSGLTGPPLFSHIHFGPPKVNGGVMVFLCGGGGKPACTQDTSGEASGTITASDIVGPAAQGIDPAPAGVFADVIRAILTGNAYANLHTKKYPGGEVRGLVVVHSDRDKRDKDDKDKDDKK
jgi:hypothetical protein